MRLYDIQEPNANQDIEYRTYREKSCVVGIDLGTTNSLIGYVKDGQVELIPDPYSGKNYTPSVIAWDGKKYLIGEEAINSGFSCVSSVKRLLLQDKIEVGNLVISPVQASAEILRYLKVRAQNYIGQDIDKAVITVPAYFDETSRQATKDAARLAGLEVLRLISEPTSAAIAYGFDKEPEGMYAVYDLGGGTFDVSILKMQKGVFQVLATGGDTFLGGDDIDTALSKLVGDRLLAKKVKEKLSTEERAGEITRNQLEAVASPFIEKTLKIFRKTINDTGIDFSDLKEVILVGGSTRMPLVSREIQALVGKNPISGINPDEIVAIGAALQANALSSGSNSLLIDVIPLSLGIEVADKIAEVIIPRNTPIPAIRTQKYATQQDNQTGIVIHVIQGEGKTVGECRSLAKFEIKGIPPMPKGAAKVEVRFQIDADGLLTVSALETTTGKVQEVIIKPSYGLNEGEMLELLSKK